MHTKLLLSLIIAVSVLMGVGQAGADSGVSYPDGTSSRAINLGNGNHGFVFFSLDNDIYVHAVDFSTNLLSVSVGSFNGFAFLLFFEGVTSGGFLQYGVYSCVAPNFATCTVSGTRRGSLFL